MLNKGNSLYLEGVPEGGLDHYSSYELVNMMKHIIDSMNINNPSLMSTEQSLDSLEYKIKALRQDGTLDDLLDELESLIDKRRSDKINDALFIDKSSLVIKEMFNR